MFKFIVEKWRSLEALVHPVVFEDTTKLSMYLTLLILETIDILKNKMQHFKLLGSVNNLNSEQWGSSVLKNKTTKKNRSKKLSKT